MPPGSPDESYATARINEIAAQIIDITDAREEEIWILRYQADKYRFVREEAA